MESQPLNISVKQHSSILVGDPQVEFHSGCKVIDVSFPNTFFVEVGEIHFKNFFTESVKIKALVRATAPDSEPSWKTAVRCLTLMASPHSEKGAEDYFTVTRKMMSFEMNNITSIRLIIRQSSPVWKDFKLEDIKMFKISHAMPHEMPLPSWIKNNDKKPEKVRQIQGVAPVETLSTIMQKMWMLCHETSKKQATSNLGRYEVDDCYEINLLSYT